MATINPPRDSLNSDKARPSPPASSASSSIGSPEIRPVNADVNGQNGINKLAANGHAAPPAEPQKVPTPAPTPTPSEKTSMTKRLTRMFSTKDATRSDVSINSSAVPSGISTPKTKPDPAPSTSTIASRPKPPSRNASSSAERAAHPETKPQKPATAPHKKPGANAPSLRFVLNPDVQGGHEHHLKSARRQEKLSDMLRSVIGGRQKNAEHQAHEGEQQLSLMSTWVDQLKSERDTLASDKKGGPTTTATLAEKYGKCQEVVGRGAFGVVRISHKRGENGVGEQLYAVKEFRRRPDESEKKYSKRLTSEFCISSSLRHPNVIHTLDLLQDSKGDYCEVMEFCAGGDLYTLVLAAGKLEVLEADCFFKQLMRGVEYMHEMGVAHRDLKPENLLLTTRGSLKITDFGNGECFRMAWEADPHMVSGLCGSAPYIAPEEYVDKEFDARAVDVWATGVIYMAMRTGRHLWRVAKKDEDEFYERYLEGRRDEAGYGPIESLHRARCRNVIYSILDPNPGRRITASQVLKSEWGREIKLCKAGEEGF
ncbi:putative Serine kinase hal4 [Venustampulla echinocandica]|uniref:non-specific serine/threonine protein kinase n=1 Tax=Venustampulla echinocandica TaxID=2656787 RepID=A0A370TI84_9HELO|nr:putative Serine kinase hal4 [Venustampulla echinocandica]RDL35057.1 putative Serine kinase hal4 [Venustampulla echinocandica]